MGNNTTTHKWTMKCEEDENGDIILPFPEDMLQQLNWQTGDILDFQPHDDDSFTIVNVSWEERQKDIGTTNEA